MNTQQVLATLLLLLLSRRPKRVVGHSCQISQRQMAPGVEHTILATPVEREQLYQSLQQNSHNEFQWTPMKQRTISSILLGPS